MSDSVNCPICLAPSKGAQPRQPRGYRYRGMVVDCRGCGVYRVTQTALAPLQALRLEERFAALRKAKCLAPARVAPTITTGCLPAK
jgi:hypothetical protein